MRPVLNLPDIWLESFLVCLLSCLDSGSLLLSFYWVSMSPFPSLSNFFHLQEFQSFLQPYCNWGLYRAAYFQVTLQPTLVIPSPFPTRTPNSRVPNSLCCQIWGLPHFLPHLTSGSLWYYLHSSLGSPFMIPFFMLGFFLPLWELLPSQYSWAPALLLTLIFSHSSIRLSLPSSHSH